MSDQPTLDGRSKLDDQSQGSQIFDMLINTSRPTSRTSDYYSLSVTVEREDFIVDTIADRSIDYYDGSKQIKINVLVSLYGHSDPRYMAVERSFIIIRSKVYDEDDSTVVFYRETVLNGDGTCYVILTNNSVLHKVVTVESIEDGEQLCLKNRNDGDETKYQWSVETDGKSNAFVALYLTAKDSTRYYAVPADTGDSIVLSKRPNLNRFIYSWPNATTTHS